MLGYALRGVGGLILCVTSPQTTLAGFLRSTLVYAAVSGYVLVLDCVLNGALSLPESSAHESTSRLAYIGNDRRVGLVAQDNARVTDHASRMQVTLTLSH